MPPEGKIRVHILSRDERVLRAGGSLSTGGYEVTRSGSPEEAAPHLLRCHVAVIDLERGGFSVVKELRGRRGDDVRVVMLCDRPHDVWLCRQAGADDVLVKPLQDPTTLKRAIA